MAKENLREIPPEESTISRKTRYAFLVAVVFIFSSVINFVISLRLSISTQTVASYLDTFTILILGVFAVISTQMIRKGQKDKGIWLLLISIATALAFRNFFIAGLGILFSILAVTLFPFIGFLLKRNQFNRSLSLSIGAGSFYLISDVLVSRFFSPYRLAAENAESIIRTLTVTTIIIVIAYGYTIYRQHRSLLLSSKLTLAMVSVVLVPIIGLSLAGSVSLKNSLIPRQNDALRVKSTLIAQSIESLISMNKSALRSETQSPTITEYMALYTQNGREAVGNNLEEQVLESLRSYKRKDILFIKSYAILDISGKNIFDTTLKNIGNDESDTAYFTQALESRLPFASDIINTRDVNEFSLYYSAPIFLNNGEIAGVLRAQYSPKILRESINNYLEVEGFNKDEVFVALLSERKVKQIDAEDPPSVFIVLANGKDPELNFMSVTPLTTNVITPLQMDRILPVGSTAQLSLDVPGLDEGLRNKNATPIFEAQAFPRANTETTALDIVAVAEIEENNLPWSIILSQKLENYNAPFLQQNETSIILAILIAIGAVITAYAGSKYLVDPIITLANAANQVAQGDLNKRAMITTEDEVGDLGIAFNTMTSQLNLLITTLEERIAERTQTLERSEEQLRAAVQVGKAAASLRNVDELLKNATELIGQQFGFYHAGIFLIDDYGEYARLTAANSEGGHRMLAREHKLKVGAEGIVGYVTSTGEARIALDVGRDAAYFDNPDLPKTRSEMALPLIAGGKILGALDIQSTESQAFSEADIASLQVLADQIAIAIENAHLFEESRRSLAAAQRAYGEQSQLGWQELLHQKENYGYRSAPDGSIFPLDKNTEDESFDADVEEKDLLLDEEGRKVAIPIMVRGETVGTIRLKKENSAASWREKDLDLAKNMTEELSRAMDSARLFDETKQQADRERVVGEISDKMRETMNVESVIRLAADELYKLLGLEQVTIHLNPDEEQRNEKSV
ncbi:MAG: GAF domain-containing protein [Chloroflexi bacterium]|nr:GAF domain-containing protein [Chloroflexota bacterium]